MAEVTVSQLAKTVGASVDRLLSQMKEAGLDHESGDQFVSDEDKQRLLTHLKSSHGVSTAAPKRITLKRKTLGTVKAAGQGRKTVSVEVRKKRTYVKRDEAVVEELPEAVVEAEELPIIEPVEANVEAAPEETVVEETIVAEEPVVEVEEVAVEAVEA
ncbi:MAG: translation initiation factor IF-2 associated domain-containing protein, partial [Pseudomonadales bacterium]|nr:translation initiation factor IF-2 associated domain-containing protein [Pseudomonadales bacterium]